MGVESEHGSYSCFYFWHSFSQSPVLHLFGIVIKQRWRKSLYNWIGKNRFSSPKSRASTLRVSHCRAGKKPEYLHFWFCRSWGLECARSQEILMPFPGHCPKRTTVPCPICTMLRMFVGAPDPLSWSYRVLKCLAYS